jgi:hypothetical protein
MDPARTGGWRVSLIPGHPVDLRVRSCREGPRPGAAALDVTSTSSAWTRGLSPFLLGPVVLPTGEVARCVENLWQFGKVYPEHVGPGGEPTPEYRAWRAAGFSDARAHRYPAGRGRRPLFYLLGAERLSYVEARRRVYVPAYRAAVWASGLLEPLREAAAAHPLADLLDHDGWDHVAEGLTLDAALGDPGRRVGHGHVLWGMLLGDPATHAGAIPPRRTRVAHCRRDPHDAYVGRGPGGVIDARHPFGSPIRIGETCPLCWQVHHDGGSTLPCYSRYLDYQLDRNAHFRMDVLRLRGLVLACHCRPPEGFRGRLMCHAQVLAGRLDQIAPELVP